MDMMYRIICRRLLILIRLVIIVSLTGYSFSNATAAMHGQSSAAAKPSAISQSNHHGSDQASHDNHGGDMDGQDRGASKLVKQECCGDYCVSMAVPIGHVAISGPAMETLRFFVDDSKAVGQTPVLHRPPNI
ncbi:hypothetical protein [Rhizobium sp. PDO1-076]|uniref:hypothetical protein n=1 Tax=Rhizobium sp. PDO1-076 TaxID=1125979 RepID=UPI0002D7A781|nr:hypothetical protein [Rhizobium sp. PDO1-076]